MLLLYSIKLRPTWRNVREYRKANQKIEINFVNHEILYKIKTGYIQTDEGGVNTQYKSNKKQKMGTYALIFMDG
jgi:hypothetical protein